jgi:demethoxyubiquinone hydroxylase (CLK1/Coq7/Cat5 family)
MLQFSPSLIKSPFKNQKLTQVQNGLYVAEDVYTGVYKFFEHSEPRYFIQLKEVGEKEYTDYVNKKLNL